MLNVLSKPRKLMRRAVAACALLALVACDPVATGGSAGAGGQRIDPSAAVPVALLIPRSDPAAAPVARSLENAARLALASLDGVEIDLRVYDTAGNAQRAAVQAETAVQQGAKIILGPLRGEAANAVAVAVADNNVNVLSFTNNASLAGGNLFVLGPTFDNIANRVMRYARAQGRDDVVIVHESGVGGQTGRNAIQQAAARNGVRVQAIESYALTQESVSATASRVRDRVQATGADSVFLVSTPAGALGNYLQQLPGLGVDPSTTQYLGLSRWDTAPQLFTARGAQGAFFAMPDPAATRAFESRYRAAYGSAPHVLGGIGFDAVAAVGALVKQGRSDALQGRALTQSAGFQGATGVFRLLPNGTNQRALAVATVRNNQVSILDPAPTRFGGAGF